MDIGTTLGSILFVILLLVGAGATFLGLPGNWLILLFTAGYGFLDNFVRIDLMMLVLLAAMVIAGEIAEFAAGALGAKQANASKRAIAAAVVGAFVGGIIGTAIMPLVGSLIGAAALAYAASYLAEYSHTGNAIQAALVAKNVMLGQIIGTVVKSAIALAMVIMIIVRLLW